MSRARGFGAAKRTLDTASSSHKLSLEGEGKKTLESRGAGFVVRLCPAQAARPTHRFCYRAENMYADKRQELHEQLSKYLV